MADPSLASNNPFRRKSTVPIASSTPSSSAASGLTLDTSSTAGPAHPSLAKSSTFPQSPSDAPFTTHGGAPGASGPTGSSGSTDDTYAYDYEDQDALRDRPQVSSNAFREHLQALPKSTEAPPSTTFLKPKPVKKVRVQSPPPSSPSSVDSVDADFEARFPSNLAEAASGSTGASAATSFSDYSARGGLLDDRPVRNYEDFESESDDSESDEDSAGRAGGSKGPTAPIPSFSSIPSQAPQQPPANPFQKTLGDLEPGQTSTEEAQADPAAAASAGKATLDVDAFSRLLLTGQGPAATPPPPPPARAEAPPPAQEAHRTSQDISENDDDRSGLIHGGPPASEPAPRQTLRKKPPPPSSRHGKLIKGQSKEKKPAKESSSGGEDPSSSSSDVNKPLPPPPARRQANTSEDEDAMDSIFDREAAGKLPEVNLDPEAPEEAVPSPRPPTPPNASHSTDFDPSHPVSDLGAEALVSSSTAPAAPVVAAAATTSPPHPKKPTPAPPPRRQAGHNRTESRSQPAGERPPLPAPPAHAAAPGDGNVSDQQRDKSPYGSPRSSLDSTRTRSRSSSLIKPGANANANPGGNVPAPPPPRRGNHASRPSTAAFAAPLHPSMSSPALSPSALSDHERAPGVVGLHPGVSTPTLAPQSGSTGGSGTSTPVPNRLLAKPPPPPARNTSVRHKERPTALTSTDSSGSVGSGVGSGRPSSVASFDAVARRVGPHHQPPPPPPTRQRGSSRGSMDAPAGHANATTNLSLLSAPPSISTTPRKVSSESVRRAAGSSGQQGLETAQEGDEDQANNATGVDESGVANNILADLDALRREVDALRGQFKAE